MNEKDKDFLGSFLMKRKIWDLRNSGVYFADENSVCIGEDVKIGKGTLIFPNVTLLGRTIIGQNCEVKNGVHIESSTIYDRTSVEQGSIIKYARVGADCIIGPYAILEGQKFSDNQLSLGMQSVKISNSCTIGAQAHLHDWVIVDREAKISHGEVVRSFIGRGTIAKHHGYIGDATIYEYCNIGAGTIFGNYDGLNKHRVIVETGVFIGIHTSIISAKTEKIGAGAFIAADTLVMEEIKPGTVVVRKVNKLEVVRYSRRTKDGWKITKTKPRERKPKTRGH